MYNYCWLCLNVGSNRGPSCNITFFPKTTTSNVSDQLIHIAQEPPHMYSSHRGAIRLPNKWWGIMHSITASDRFSRDVITHPCPNFNNTLYCCPSWTVSANLRLLIVTVLRMNCISRLLANYGIKTHTITYTFIVSVVAYRDIVSNNISILPHYWQLTTLHIFAYCITVWWPQRLRRERVVIGRNDSKPRFTISHRFLRDLRVQEFETAIYIILFRFSRIYFPFQSAQID